MYFSPQVLMVALSTAFLSNSLLIPGAASCKRVQIRFTTEPAAAVSCTSAIGLCQTGSTNGAATGTFTFVGTTLIPTVDSPTTAVVFVTGDRTIQTSAGTILVKDAFAFSTTDESYSGVSRIVGGSGVFLGASGVLRLGGTGITIAGDAKYEGEVCVP